MSILKVKVAVISLLSFSLAGCEGLLDVELPGFVTSDDLDNPLVAETLRRSVIGSVENAWDGYVLDSANHSDEWMPASGNIQTKRMGLRRIDADFDFYINGTYAPLHRARAEADEFFERIKGMPNAEVRNKDKFLAEIRAWGTWPLIALGEGFCGSPIDGGDRVLDRKELLALAEKGFTEAIQLAQAAGLPRIATMAQAGRARARLGQENYSGAIADAEMIPEGFIFLVSRDASEPTRWNALYNRLNGLPGDNAARKRGSMAPSYRDVRWKGVDDPRVNVIATGTTTFDFTTEHFRHDKINSLGDPTRLASWEEAQLMIAEAAAMTGDLSRARTILNGFHQRARIPPVTEADIPTRSAVIRHVIEERRRELLSEAGARLRDHIRWRGTEFEIPFLGEPGSDHPKGFDLGGERYGDTTCFPVPTIDLPT